MFGFGNKKKREEKKHRRQERRQARRDKKAQKKADKKARKAKEADEEYDRYRTKKSLDYDAREVEYEPQGSDYELDADGEADEQTGQALSDDYYE